MVFSKGHKTPIQQQTDGKADVRVQLSSIKPELKRFEKMQSDATLPTTLILVRNIVIFHNICHAMSPKRELLMLF